jgi:hypothetical protein
MFFNVTVFSPTADGSHVVAAKRVMLFSNKVTFVVTILSQPK